MSCFGTLFVRVPSASRCGNDHWFFFNLSAKPEAKNQNSTFHKRKTVFNRDSLFTHANQNNLITILNFLIIPHCLFSLQLHNKLRKWKVQIESIWGRESLHFRQTLRKTGRYNSEFGFFIPTSSCHSKYCNGYFVIIPISLFFSALCSYLAADMKITKKHTWIFNRFALRLQRELRRCM